jgi:hypothetical protein
MPGAGVVAPSRERGGGLAPCEREDVDLDAGLITIRKAKHRCRSR